MAVAGHIVAVAAWIGTARTLPGDIAPIVESLSPILAQIATIPHWLYWGVWGGGAALLILMSFLLERNTAALEHAKVVGAAKIEDLPRMTLPEVARHIAIKSKWAVTRCPAGEAGIDAIDRELTSALGVPDRLVAYGVYHMSSSDRDLAHRPVPIDFWERAQFDTRKLLLVADDPPNRAYRFRDNGGYSYEDLLFERRRVEALWPARHPLARRLAPSPFVRWVRTQPNGGQLKRDYGSETFDQLFGS